MLPLKTPIAAVALTVTVYAQPSFHLVAWSPSIDADTVLYYDEERNLRTTSVNTFGDSTLNGSTYTATGELNTRYEVVYNHESIPLKVVLYNDADSVVSRDMSISSPPGLRYMSIGKSWIGGEPVFDTSYYSLVLLPALDGIYLPDSTCVNGDCTKVNWTTQTLPDGVRCDWVQGDTLRWRIDFSAEGTPTRLYRCSSEGWTTDWHFELDSKGRIITERFRLTEQGEVDSSIGYYEYRDAVQAIASGTKTPKGFGTPQRSAAVDLLGRIMRRSDLRAARSGLIVRTPAIGVRSAAGRAYSRIEMR